MEANGPPEEPPDTHLLKTFLPDNVGDGLGWMECSDRIREMLVGFAIARQGGADPRHQAIEVQGVKKGEKSTGRREHIQGNKSPARSQQSIGLEKKETEVGNIAQDKGGYNGVKEVVFKRRQ